MRASRVPRDIPLRFDDGVRGGITLGAATLILIALLTLNRFAILPMSTVNIVAASCAALATAFIAYVFWTHRVFSRETTAEVREVAKKQHQRGASIFSRLLGMKSAESWAISASGAALAVALAVTVYGSTDTRVILTPLALITAAASWATVVYSFALRYFRLDSAGESFDFDIHEDPKFTDFVSMALTISAAGAQSAATPRSRAGLTVVRTHIVLAYVFNAIILALLVSLVAGLGT